MTIKDQIKKYIEHNYPKGQYFTTEKIYEKFRDQDGNPHGTVANVLDTLKNDDMLDNKKVDNDNYLWRRI